MKRWASLFGALVVMMIPCVAAAAQPKRPEPVVVPLWEDDVPDSLGEGEGHTPTLTYYCPRENQAANGAAVLICPGGGYGHLAIDHEGRLIGYWLNTLGITGVMLTYRHGAQGYQHPVPWHDAQRGMRLMRQTAAKFNLDPKRMGVMGFSAGGHLAASLATRSHDGNPGSDDLVERESCRPDFAILCYPVITMVGPYTHEGSRNNLMGSDAERALREELSCDRQVTERTPPTFLFHTSADTAVPVQNSLLFAAALSDHHVPVELHVFQEGRHGIGLGRDVPYTGTWSDRCADWLRLRGVIPAPPAAEK